MKKQLFLFGLGSMLLLGACGSEEASQPVDQPKETAPTEPATPEPAKEAEESTEVEEPETESDEASLEYADAAELAEGSAHPIQFYEAEDPKQETEEGMIRVEFEGFNLEFTAFLVDFKPSEEFLYDFEEKETVRALLITTQAENINEFDVDYSGGMTIVTDTKEQVSPESGILTGNPIHQTYYGPVEAEGYSIIPLEDGSEPKELTLIMDPPWKVENGAVNTETGQMGEEQRVKLKVSNE
ncbi:hypothetical protein [Planococcus sp. YIM B11945]|uniref:hypothetical protein n=1 Tax=Planococcus sp. YIM B11945 TaxID=3435410 RepID=UPI003D7D6C78